MNHPLQRHRRSLRGLVGLFALLIVVSIPTSAQKLPVDPFSAGRVYVLAVPDTVGNERDDIFADTRLSEAAVVMIYSPVANRARITGGNGLVNWSTPLDSGRITTIDLMRPEFRDPFGPLSPDPSVQRKNAFRLETDEPVIVTCMLQTIWGTESWSPLPLEAWGTEYYAAAYPGDIVRNVFYVNKAIRTRAQAAPSEIVLVAAYDNTQIAVFPSGPIVGLPSVISLNANEAFQLRSFVDTMPRSEVFQSDLGGSYIVSTKPIGVITGNTRTAIIDERQALTKNALKGMAFEALAPSDEHGQAFAYTPVFDDLRVTGTSGEQLSTKRPGEMIRVYGTWSDSTRGELTSSIDAPTPILVSRATLQQIRLDGQLTARYLTTSGPVQAMTSPSAVSRPATGGGYDTWSAFTAELVPREQWTSFAPFIALAAPTGMRHYINVVTDTVSQYDIIMDGRPFKMNMGAVPGSDLIWGTVEVSVSYQHYLEGRNGAKFTATMYGLLAGSEKSIKNTYREYLALSYGHALAPARRALRMRDELALDTARDCRGLAISVRTARGTVETIRRVWMDSASNVRMSTGASAPTITPLSLRIDAIDPTVSARATVYVEDRAGTIRSVAYERAGELASIAPATGLWFGEAMAGDTLTRQFSIRNRSTVPITVRGIRFISGRAGFELADTFAPRELAPDETIELSVRAQPAGAVGQRSDTIVASLACSELRMPLTLSVVEPCLELADLDFGSVEPGTLATRTLTVCNRGRGRLRLLSVSGDSALVWSDPAFTVNPVFFELLRNATLGPGECMNVEVFFLANRSGRYRTIARATPSAGACRDSSLWTATVSSPTGVASEHRAAVPLEAIVRGRAITLVVGPARGDDAPVLVYDATGRLVAGPLEPKATSNRIEWNASALAPGVYYCTRVVDGRVDVEPIILH
jgi:hypothetical protein